MSDKRQTKDGYVFKGTCDLCGEKIYTGYDHDEDCIYRS